MLKILILFILPINMCHALSDISEKNTVKDCKEKAKGPCYEFGGRARVYYNKGVRIWKKGTRRLYQLHSQTESAFNDLKHISLATEIWADFDVCFLKPETQSGFSDICVQSVKNYKTRPVPEN